MRNVDPGGRTQTRWAFELLFCAAVGASEGPSAGDADSGELSACLPIEDVCFEALRPPLEGVCTFGGADGEDVARFGRDALARGLGTSFASLLTARPASKASKSISASDGVTRPSARSLRISCLGSVKPTAPIFVASPLVMKPCRTIIVATATDLLLVPQTTPPCKQNHVDLILHLRTAATTRPVALDPSHAENPDRVLHDG